MLKYGLGLVLILCLGLFWLDSREIPKAEKANGVSLVSPREPIHDTIFNRLSIVHPNFVAIIPYAFTRKSDANVIFNHHRQWWGEKPAGVFEMIRQAKKSGLKIMLKPHIWVGGDGWPGDLNYTLPEWDKWEKDYRDYVLTYAKIADSAEVDLFCIGTEIRWSVKERADFWKNLISDVRSVYDGPLTYAANWDNYQHVSFWQNLDFIGIDAYFPLHPGEIPSVAELTEAWRPIKGKLRKLSEETGKPILFTEYGYNSVQKNASEPWKIEENIIDEQCQVTAYKALYATFWSEDWFAGGFLWKWHLSKQAGGKADPNFTPQGKATIQTIRDHYSKYKN